jgi:hypothetical protein
MTGVKMDFTAILAEIESVRLDDYPDQKAEYKTLRAVEAGVEAVERIAEVLSDSVAEREAIEFAVAMKILKHRQGHLEMNVMRERLLSRTVERSQA